MGRPVKWTPEKKSQATVIILNRIMDGESCRSVLDKADRNILPSNRVFLEWLSESDELSKQYAHACIVRADSIFDDMFTIADNQDKDVTIVDGTEVVNHNVIQRSRLRIDTRKWALSKMNPKKYGDKLDITSKDKSINKTPEIRVNTEEEKKQIDEWLNKL